MTKNIISFLGGLLIAYQLVGTPSNDSTLLAYKTLVSATMEYYADERPKIADCDLGKLSTEIENCKNEDGIKNLLVKIADCWSEETDAKGRAIFLSEFQTDSKLNLKTIKKWASSRVELFLITDPSRYSKPNFKEYISKLEEYELIDKQELDNEFQAPPHQDKTKPVQEVIQPNTDETPSKGFSFLWIIPTLLSLIAIGLTFLNHKKLQALIQENNQRQEDSLKTLENKIKELIKKTSDDSQENHSFLFEKLSKIESDQKTLKRQETIALSFPNTEKTTYPASTPTVQFYAESPDITNGFAKTRLSQTPTDRSLYVITEMGNGNYSFKIYERSIWISNALDDVAQNFQRVCEGDFNPNRSYSSVSTLAPGTLQIQGSNLIVQTKAKIELR